MEPRLAYCTNVVPAPDLPRLIASLEALWADVRRQVGGPSALGLGLWLPEALARELDEDADARKRLTDTLAANELSFETVNAFPAKEFHAPVVKKDVYRPHWGEPARFEYTLTAARAAAALLPSGSDVTLSTLPIGYGPWAADDLKRVAKWLRVLADRLARIEDETGTVVRVALEPEPGCVLERTEEAVRFHTEYLLPGGDRERIERHLGICLDLCHAAVEHEDPVAALEELAAAGVPVHKVQVSAALEIPDPTDDDQRQLAAAFDEPRWLHQVGRGYGDIVEDLPLVLEAAPPEPGTGPWRVHFHVPVNAASAGGLPTTRSDVEAALRHLAGRDTPPVLEIETYTWSVVPDAGDDLAANIAGEIRFVQDVLSSA